MYYKAVMFGDQEAAARVLQAETPWEAKSVGREVRGFDEGEWAAVRRAVVVRGNVAKFMDNEAAREYLLLTAGKVLVEASPTDVVWGVGLTELDPRVAEPAQWRGENLLGFSLMEVRQIVSSHPPERLASTLLFC
jgi:hypothetical protein